MTAEDAHANRLDRPHRRRNAGEEQVDIVDHEIEDDADVGRAKGISREPFGRDVHGSEGHAVEGVECGVEPFDVADLEHGLASIGEGDELLGPSSVVASGFSTSVAMPSFKERAGDLPSGAPSARRPRRHRRGRGGRGSRQSRVCRFSRRRPGPVRGERRRHPRVRRPGIAAEDSGVVLTQMADPDTATPRFFAGRGAFMTVSCVSRARPCLPAC